MLRLTLTFMALLVGLVAATQTQVAGRIVNARKKPLAGVNITIKDSYDGATTDSLGNFSFSTTATGSQVVQAEMTGYKLFQQSYMLNGQPLKLEILMKEAVDEMTAVVITAGSFEASDKKKTTVLSSLDVVTTASGNGDVTGALKTLPGAQQVGESEGLFVRGGTAAETKTFIDGTVVNNFFFSSTPGIATRGRFSPFIFKGTVFSTGGYSALYGQAMSSALILESIDLPDQTSGSINASVIGVGGGYQHLDKNKRYSFGGSYNYTDLRLAFALIKQRQEYEDVPVFHTADANFRIKTSKTGMLKYYGQFGTNKLKFYTNSIDTLGYLDGFGIANTNYYHNLSYRESFGRWKMNLGASYTYNKDNVEGGLYAMDKQQVQVDPLFFKNFKQRNIGNYFNAKWVMERKIKGLSAVRGGLEYNHNNDDIRYTAFDGQVFNFLVKDRITSAFAEADIYVTNNIAAKLGGRYEHSTLLNKSNIAPRLSLAYKINKESQASLAYGVFYQNPERQYFPSFVDLNFTKATHYIAQYQRVTSLTTFRTELFYKKYDQLIKTAVQNFQPIATGNTGFGDAKGIEVFWRDKKTVKNLDYWISYSYLHTQRDYLNFPEAIQPSFAATHTASLVLKRFVTKWKTQFNAAYNYASGRPYYYILPEQTGFKFVDRGQTKAYNNLSLSVNYLPNIGNSKSKVFAVYVLSVSNVLGFDQVFNYQYSYNGFRKEAIRPPSRTFVFIGAFLSFGIDRSQEAINSNL
ncbi:MAG: TonB-dependent receptor [Sphingobacteriales bacterium]|nr:MAG: TonB-dependent receptor [Sphingobacteriales bacterium]